MKQPDNGTINSAEGRVPVGCSCGVQAGTVSEG